MPWRCWRRSLPALLVLLALAHFQPPGAQSASLFHRLDPAREAILRARGSYVFVSTWQPWQCLDYGIEAAILLLAAWRARRALPAPLGAFLWVMPAFGLVAIPLSWVLLDWQRWAFVPAWQPARSVLFVTLGLQIVASAAGVRAALERRWLPAIAWLALAFALVVKHAVPGPPLHLAPLVLALSLASVALAAASAPPKYRAAILVLAGLVPFAAIARIGPRRELSAPGARRHRFPLRLGACRHPSRRRVPVSERPQGCFARGLPRSRRARALCGLEGRRPGELPPGFRLGLVETVGRDTRRPLERKSGRSAADRRHGRGLRSGSRRSAHSWRGACIREPTLPRVPCAAWRIRPIAA